MSERRKALLGLALCRYVLRLEPIATSGVEDAIAGVAPAVQLYLDWHEPAEAAGRD